MGISVRVLNDFYVTILILYTLVLSGVLQFFLGLSFTIVTFLSVSTFLLFYIIKPKSSLRTEYLPFISISVLMILYMVIISIYNGQGIIRPILYAQFFLAPVAMLLLLYSKDNKSFLFIKLKSVKKILLFLAILQLPILIIQRVFVDSLILFNNSGKLLDAVDFYIGTFPLKNDHSLGFFLVLNLLYIWSYKVLKNKFQLLFVTVILLTNLLLINSNTSVLFALGAIAYMMLRDKKFKLNFSFKKIILLAIGVAILFFIVEYYEPKFYHDIKLKLTSKLNLKEAIKWYKRGLARREQIVLVLMNDGVNYIGNGAYSYFDIISGRFNKTFRHFSQLIWTYYDLGIVGLTMFLFYLKSMHNVLKERNANYNIYLTFGLLLYSFFTVVTFDLSFMLAYFIYKRKDD